jgi:aspartyl/glutamyl-tRNA(Asn/Gln) amidotransferase C subunit
MAMIQHMHRVSALVASSGGRALRTRTLFPVPKRIRVSAVHTGASQALATCHIVDMWRIQFYQRTQRIQLTQRTQQGQGRMARSSLATVHASSGDDLLTDIDKLSELAQIKLTEAEKREMGPQIERIVDWMGQLNNVNVDGVRPSMRGGDEGAEGHLDTAWLRPDVEVEDPKDVEGRVGVLETNEEGFLAVPPGVFR